MKTRILSLALLTFAGAVQAGPYNFFLVGNRNDSSVTRVDGDDFAQRKLYTGRTVGSAFEPMYISKVRTQFNGGILDHIAVGDRKNNQVIIHDSMGARVQLKIPVSKGPFHQYSSGLHNNLLAIATDIEKGVDLIEFTSHTSARVRRFQLPERFSAGKPHDVIFDQNDFYVTVTGMATGDVLLQVDLKTLTLKKTRQFSKDIHLANPADRDFFLLLEQENGKIRLVNKSTLKDESVVRGPIGVHGVYTDDEASVVFVTNIASPGTEAVLAYQLKNGRLEKVASVDLTVGGAHNIAVSGTSLLITHSGAQSTSVSRLEFDLENTELRLIETLTTGLNPFGIQGFNL